jgi:hypothetical protein
MIRIQEPELSPLDDNSVWHAWRKTWSEDEWLLAHTPPGYWYDLVNISRVKRILQWEIPPDVRLRFLELLNGYVRDLLTLEAMQRVEPACDTAMKMLDEMNSLSIDDKSRLMRRWNVIATFVNLNPSIIEAIKLFSSRHTQRAPAA